MELSEEEKYASAALFTLAIYTTTFETGVACGGADDGCWGVPFEDVCNAYCKPGYSRDFHNSGWQVVSPSGICGRVFASLGIRSAAMPGLIALADAIHPLNLDDRKDALLHMVESYARLLDADLQFSVQASSAAILAVSEGRVEIDNTSPSERNSAQSLAAFDTARADGCDAATSADADVQGSISQSVTQDEKALEESLRAALMELNQSPDNQKEVDAQNRRLESMLLTEGAVLPQPSFVPSVMYMHKASPKSIAALSMVILGCIIRVISAPEKRAHVSHWYDARARVACKRLAHWLCVPTGTMDALEAHAMSQLPALEEELNDDTKSNWRGYYSSSAKWMKVGAAAVGGATLMAVTAGLAAPAIVAGIGTAVGMAGSAGAGAAIAGAASTSASVGIVSGGMGAAGAAHYSKKMAWRTADVKEIGFVRLTAWDRWRDSQPEDDAEADPMASDASLGAQSSVADSAYDDASVSASERQNLLCQSSSGGPRELDAASSQGSARTQSPSRGKRLKKRWWSRKKPSMTVTEEDGTVRADPLRNPLPTPRVDDESSGQAGILIAVNGSIRCMEDFVTPWASLPRKYGDTYAVVWEKGPLMEVGQAFVKLLAKNGAQLAAQWALSASVLTSGLVAAMAWPIGILSAASFIDSAWDVASNRAVLAGQLLAHMLMARVHGDRPVTLVGLSLGARLVFHCCLELYKQGAMGIIEHVVLLGAPVSVNMERWSMVRSAIAGRMINGYSPLDWTLAMMFRSSITSKGFIKKVAGLSAVSVPGVEDCNLSDLVKGHADYAKAMDQILKVINLRGEEEASQLSSNEAEL